MAKYKAWFVHQQRDEQLEQFLQTVGYPNVNLDYREPTSLRWIDGVLTFSARDPGKVFDQIPEPGRSLSAISSALPGDIRRFHNQLFQFGVSRYRVLVDAEAEPHSDSPYNKRFLTIKNDSTGVAEKLDESRKIGPRDPGVPNLWFKPEQIELTPKQVGFCFGPDPRVEYLKGSFLLPPTRVLDDDDFDIEFDNHPPAHDSFFDPELVALRSALRNLMGQPPPGAAKASPFDIAPVAEVECLPSALYDPAIVTMLRLFDEPLLRDVFLDGGSMQIAGDDGKPTRIVLRLAGSGLEAEAYRQQFVLKPGSIGGPEWAKDLARAVRADMAALLPNNALELDSAGNARNWNIRPLPSQTNHTGGPEGAWTYLKAIYDRLPSSWSGPRATFLNRILNPSAGKANRPDPDHDLAETLFLDQVWRQPWDYAPQMFDPWREAFRECLADELTKGALTPEERAEKWNRERQANNFKCQAKPWQDLERTYFLGYAGPHEPDSVVLWQLLLPWRSIVNARTLILDHATRSVLSGKYVLA